MARIASSYQECCCCGSRQSSATFRFLGTFTASVPITAATSVVCFAAISIRKIIEPAPHPPRRNYFSMLSKTRQHCTDSPVWTAPKVRSFCCKARHSAHTHFSNSLPPPWRKSPDHARRGRSERGARVPTITKASHIPEQNSAGQSRVADSKIAGRQRMENNGTSPARMSFQNRVRQNPAADSKIAVPPRMDCNDKKAASEPGAQNPARGLFPVRLSPQASLRQIGSARSNERGTFLQ
jgi:hypothetical protein